MNKKGFIGEIIFIILVIGLIALIVFLINLGMKKECKMEAEIMGFEWKYNFWIDCMIKVEDQWIYSDNYIINKEEKQGEKKHE